MTNPNHGQERAAYWQEEISKQAVSGMTALAYCKQNSLGLHTFYCWRKRLRERAQEPSAKGGKQRPVHFAVVEAAAATQAASIQVMLRSGDRIEIAGGAETAAVLETILRVLRQDVRP